MTTVTSLRLALSAMMGSMDSVGFRSWLDVQGLQPSSVDNAVCDCTRVELYLALDLDDLRSDSDVEALRASLHSLPIDSGKPETVVATLLWSLRKYVRFRTDAAKAKASAAGL